jgi:hypothetical protein
MIRIFVIMHHIALFTSCIALYNYGHRLHIRVDHVESKTENQAEQIQCVFGDSEASSCEDTDIAWDQGKPRCI